MDDYAYFIHVYNITDFNDTVEYATGAVVKLCAKAEVNRFGAKYLPAFYYINFLLSFLGNCLVLCIIYKYEKLNTVTNIFLLNLVVSDLLFATTLPFWATYHASEWIFGNALCKLVGSMYSVGFYSSILFLTLMTFDRYLAVVHAITAAKSRRNRYAYVSSAVVWGLSICASIKDFVLHRVQENQDYGLLCEELGYSYLTITKWKMVGYCQQLVVFFMIPLIMVLYCYVRITVRVMSTRMKEKCRAVKLIFMIVFIFFICWTPYNVVILLKAVRMASSVETCSDDLDYALYVTQNIAYLYCCVSPLFYTFVGKKFQSHFRKLLSKHIPCLKSVISESSRTTSYRSPPTLNEQH